MFTLASEESYEGGEVIIKEETRGDWVYVVLSGAVQVFRTVNGKEVVIETLGPGKVFGELGFIGETKRTASVKAIGPTTLGVIDRTYLDQEYNKLSADFRSILVSVVTRFKKLLDRAVEYSIRRDVRIPKTLSVMYKERESFVKAVTGNIGPGGLFIKTRNPLDKGTQILLKLQLPGLAEPLNIKAQVAWSTKGEPRAEAQGMGVKFVAMGHEDESTLKEYLRKQ